MAAAAAQFSTWGPDKKHSDRERWICIYPAYINSKKTRQEGRRIPKDNCVENPTYQEIVDVLMVSNLKIGVENKRYPRENSKEPTVRGRVRVQLKNDDGSTLHKDFPTRDSLLFHLGQMIPQLKSRQGKSSNTANQQSSSQSNKKGKGKRR